MVLWVVLSGLIAAVLQLGRTVARRAADDKGGERMEGWRMGDGRCLSPLMPACQGTDLAGAGFWQAGMGTTNMARAWQGLGPDRGPVFFVLL